MAVCQSFYVKPPDADGDVWLVFTGHETTGRGAVNLGKPERIVAQVALHLEETRKEAVAP